MSRTNTAAPVQIVRSERSSEHDDVNLRDVATELAGRLQVAEYLIWLHDERGDDGDGPGPWATTVAMEIIEDGIKALRAAA